MLISGETLIQLHRMNNEHGKHFAQSTAESEEGFMEPQWWLLLLPFIQCGAKFQSRHTD